MNDYFEILDAKYWTKRHNYRQIASIVTLLGLAFLFWSINLTWLGGLVALISLLALSFG